MDVTDEDDFKLLRASAALLADLEEFLPKLLRKKEKVRRRLREHDLERVFTLIEPFQEDPQLLDSHLKSLLPQLILAYIDTLRISPKPAQKQGFVPLSHGICQILNLFCKVRGEKVVKGFLNNEPRFLEPILLEFEKGDNLVVKDDGTFRQSIVPWAERYILLLWLSHLMLVPFPLASISAVQSSQHVSQTLGIDLPPEMSGIALRILHVSFSALLSASKERTAAASLLVRLCVRPDMQQLGLVGKLVKWSLSFFSNVTKASTDIHQCLGILLFLSKLVTSATNEELGPLIPAIYSSCQNILGQEHLSSVKSSAVARKLIIKILRNIVLHCLQSEATFHILDTTVVLEEAIEFLLEALADGDTPVRYSASKALSIITMKLDPEMAMDVVEAILGSLNENVYWQGSKRNLSGVNPLRWHGLTLTIAHLLYRRALSTSQLPAVLNALLLALAFEQRSANGGSVGTNVRDAACFGIWGLSRRYNTEDLLLVDTSTIRASQHYKSLSVPQVLAVELLVVACLDPAGNIRRGSSAALQELIGRHPNTIEEGIPLVQIVDYHAVGLRERAMSEVTCKAAGLHQVYWRALFEDLLGWRGTGSLDAPSRQFAARAIGSLSVGQPPNVVRDMGERISQALKTLRPRQVEERHGIVLALSALVDSVQPTEPLTSSPDRDVEATAVHMHLVHLWTLLTNELKLDDKSFISPALRPEYTAYSICCFLNSMASFTLQGANSSGVSFVPTEEVIRLVNLSLRRNEASVLQAVPSVARAVAQLLAMINPVAVDSMIADWLTKLESDASYNGLGCSGHTLALGAVYPILSQSDIRNRLVEVLTFRCTPAVAVEARNVALKALDILISSCHTSKQAWPLPHEVSKQISKALHVALNDYTITERGDIGSLVRLESLNTVATAQLTGLLDQASLRLDIHADCTRLATERLDKVRCRAVETLSTWSGSTSLGKAGSVSSEEVSSFAYFNNALNALQITSPQEMKEAALLGVFNSAGMGSESVLQNARAALIDTLDSIPTTSTEGAGATLQTCMELIIDLLKRNLETDRVLLPFLEIIAFLFDMQIMDRLAPTNFNFRVLLSLTQKAHFKSTHMQKLHLALDVYRGLGTIPSTRKDTIAKVASMLLHPFPKIRIAAAETLWMLTQNDGLKRHDWSLPSKSLKPAVDEIRQSL